MHRHESTETYVIENSRFYQPSFELSKWGGKEEI